MKLRTSKNINNKKIIYILFIIQMSNFFNKCKKKNYDERNKKLADPIPWTTFCLFVCLFVLDLYQ